MKKLLGLCLLLTVFLSFGQEVSLKQGIVNIDGKACFKYETKGLFGDDTTFKSNDGKTLFFMDLLDATGKGGSMKIYNKISFIGSDKVVTLSDGYSRKQVIQGLIETGVISNCEFIHDNIGDFANRYDQHIESSIVRPSY